MTAGTTPAAKPLIPRIKYWLDLYKVYGMATESSIEVLHYPDVFLIGLSGEPTRHAYLPLSIISAMNSQLHQSVCCSFKGSRAVVSLKDRDFLTE